MKHLKASGLLAGIGTLAIAGLVVAAPMFHEVKPNEYDPGHTFLVQAAWLGGIGCVTNGIVASYPDNTTSAYSDPACPTGDPKDKQNQGLLLAKTGPTTNNASAGATLKDVKGTITELGYDIRKPMSFADPRGSHCGAGAPRFNLYTSSGPTQFIGCSSPAPTMTNVGNGWIRLRWTVSATDVTGAEIVFDEGQDAGPDMFGLAVLDNIDVNGVLVGQGPQDPNAKP
jgi:hypothetical protein